MTILEKVFGSGKKGVRVNQAFLVAFICEGGEQNINSSKVAEAIVLFEIDYSSVL
jgi:hypothetical protein